MLDWLKKLIFYFWNPRNHLVRDSNGYIVPDFRSRRQSKKTQKALDSGELLVHGYHGTMVRHKKGESRHYKVEQKGKVHLLRTSGGKNES